MLRLDHHLECTIVHELDLLDRGPELDSPLAGDLCQDLARRHLAEFDGHFLPHADRLHLDGNRPGVRGHKLESGTAGLRAQADGLFFVVGENANRERLWRLR